MLRCFRATCAFCVPLTLSLYFLPTASTGSLADGRKPSEDYRKPAAGAHKAVEPCRRHRHCRKQHAGIHQLHCILGAGVPSQLGPAQQPLRQPSWLWVLPGFNFERTGHDFAQWHVQRCASWRSKLRQSLRVVRQRRQEANKCTAGSGELRPK